MFSVMGLAVDLGWAYFIKERVQTAADAAAIAAAVYALNNNDSCGTVTCGVSYTCAGVTPPTNALQSGCLYATTDGPPVLSTTMIENNGSNLPAGLTGVAPSMWIKATASASNSNMFLFLSGFHTSAINAQSVAGFTKTAGGCIYALSNSGVSLSNAGNPTITSTCGIYDNGGFNFGGSGSLSTTQLLVNGDFSFNGSGSVTASSKIQVGGAYSKTGSGTVSPMHTIGTSRIADPFAGTIPPTVGACDYTDTKITGSSPTTLSPGVYCGGLDIEGSGGVTFNTGTYIINGGKAGVSFKYNGSGDLNGTNVTFFITGRNGYTAKPISVSGSGNMNFSAPSSGTWMGLLFYQDPGVTYAGTNSFSGSGTVTGTLYFPTTNLSYSGSTTAEATALVASQISLVGSSSFLQDTTGQLTGVFNTRVSLLQ